MWWEQITVIFHKGSICPKSHIKLYDNMISIHPLFIPLIIQGHREAGGNLNCICGRSTNHCTMSIMYEVLNWLFLQNKTRILILRIILSVLFWLMQLIHHSHTSSFSSFVHSAQVLKLCANISLIMLIISSCLLSQFLDTIWCSSVV